MQTNKVGIRFKLAIVNCFMAIGVICNASDSLHVWRAGACIKKQAGFYWLNGVSLDYSSSRICGSKLHAGTNVTSSLLGSAMVSSAIPLYMAELYSQWHFRHTKMFGAILGLNAGFAIASYHDTFKMLPSTQPLLSPEIGIRASLPYNLQGSLSFGYNLITGNGIRNLGLVYPVFFNFRLLYKLPQRTSVPQ